jgi:hypothetical protein
MMTDTEPLPQNDIQTELVDTLRKIVDDGVKNSCNGFASQLNATLSLTQGGGKVASSNIEGALAAAHIGADYWKQIANFTAQAIRRASTSGFDMWRNLATASDLRHNWTMSGAAAEQSVPGALVERATMFNKAWLNAVDAMSRQLLEPLSPSASKAKQTSNVSGRPGNGHASHTPKSGGNLGRADAPN